MTARDHPTAPARILSVADVAKRCGVSQDSVRRAIRRGDLVASKSFGRVLVREEDLDAYLNANRIGGRPIASRRRPAAAAKPDLPGSLRALSRRSRPTGEGDAP